MSKRPTSIHRFLCRFSLDWKVKTSYSLIMIKTRRIGPRMHRVYAYVHESMSRGVAPRVIDVARHVGPHGSLSFGYRTVERAIKAGLVRKLADPDHKGWYFLDLAQVES